MEKTPSNRFSENQGEQWDSCIICGKSYLFVELSFDSGSVEPQIGETLTGATTGCTGAVKRLHLLTGSWAGGDAAGYLYLENPTGWHWPHDICFDNDEDVNGSVGGTNILTCQGDGLLKRSGRLYQSGDIVEYQGKKYCRTHYHIYWDKRLSEKSRYDVSEGKERESGY